MDKVYAISKESLSLAEIVDLPLRVLVIVPTSILFNVTRCLYLAWSRGLPLGFYAKCGVIRVALGQFAPRQMQLLSPSTLQVYKTWVAQRLAKARKEHEITVLKELKEDIEPLPDGRSSIMWIGDRKKATKFVLFFHGGGYIAWMTEGHLEWCLQAYLLADENVNVAVAVLQYTMCPAAQYPLHLRQATAALDHMLESGIDPDQIVIGGDSAGGNLTAQLLGHLLHPHPDIDPIKLTRPLLAAFAVSPWVSTSTNTSSFRENGHIDMLSPEMLTKAGRTLLEGTGHDIQERQGRGWAMPVDTDEAWFDGLSKVTQDLYVTVGKQEVLRDQGLVFADRIRRRNKDVKVTLEVAEKEAHDFILLEGMDGTVGDATVRMRHWFLTVISKQ